MGDVVDFNRYKKAKDAGGSTKQPRRRKTPGGRGFNEDITRQLSLSTPNPDTDNKKTEDNDPPEAD